MNLKYVLKSGKTLHEVCCGDNNKYKLCQWLIKNKGLTPDEALEWKHTPAREDQKIRRQETHRRYLGYSDDELHISKEEAHLKGLIKRGTVFYGGRTISQLAKEYGVRRGALYYRIRTLGMSWKDAVSYKSRYDTVIRINGISLYELYGKKKAHAIMDRINRGWGIETAINVPICSKWKNLSLDERYGEDRKWV